MALVATIKRPGKVFLTLLNKYALRH